MTFPGPTKHGTVRCPHCHHDTGQMPKYASVTWSKEDPMPPISFPIRQHICGWCQGMVYIPGDSADPPDDKPPVFIDAADITAGNVADKFSNVLDALAQIQPTMIGPASMTQNTAPAPVPASPPKPPPGPPREPTRPTRELLFDDDDGWDDEQ